MEEGKQLVRRSNILIALFFICLICFSGILYNAQIVNGSTYLAQSNVQVTTTETVETSRGIITDRNGKVLVTNQETYAISFDPDAVPNSGDPAVSRKRSVALAALRLIRLCEEYGVSWTDGLPLSRNQPFAYTFSSAGSTQRVRFQRYLADQGWSDTSITASTAFPMMSDSLRESLGTSARSLSANQLLQLMRKSFDLPEDLSDEEARLAVGVLYELALRNLKKSAVTEPYLFARDVPVEVISILHDGQFAGAEVCIESVRQYNTDYAAHVLGRVAAIDSKEEQAQLNEPYNAAREAGEDTSGIHYYRLDDKVGKDGVEKAFEKYLCGLDGKQLITTDREGKITNEIYSVEPKPGGTVALTIDIDFQAKVEAALAETVNRMNESKDIPERGGAAAVVSVADSSVLALATYPTYSQRTYRDDLEELSANPGRPFVNRALAGAYTPGSTLKPCTAVAALESGVITPTSTILTKGKYTYYRDYQPACWLYNQGGGSHGRINVSQALYHSCNYFFYEVGRLMGIEKLDEFMTAFGLGQPTGIELWESTGTMAGPAYSESQGQTWVPGNTIQAAIGQSDNTFTPLQLANYIATLVRGGERYSAHLLKDIMAYDGSELLYSYEPELLDTVSMSASTLAAVKKGMGDLAAKGSISRYFKECIVTAGAKTGSAQLGNAQTDGVFVCFAPFENPEIAVAVVIEKGGSGSAVASTAVAILNAYFSDETAVGAALVPEGVLLP